MPSAVVTTMTRVAVTANPGSRLAGYPPHASSPPPALIVLCFAALALVFAAFAVAASLRRQRVGPLRQEMQARPAVTFRARVDVKANVLGIMLPARGRLDLIVRSDAFEVSHPVALARFLFGQDYCYRAEDTTVRTVPGLLCDWIEIDGPPVTPADRIQIRRRDMNRQIWDALISAGAHPTGPFPAR